MDQNVNIGQRSTTLMRFQKSSIFYSLNIILQTVEKYTNEPKHYDHLPNMLLVLRVLPKQRRPAEHGLYKTPEGVLWYLAPKH